jgi:hypothetical protein
MHQTLDGRIQEALGQQALGIGQRFAAHYGEDTAQLVAQLRKHLDGTRLASLFRALNDFAGTHAQAVPTVEIRDDFAWVTVLMCDDNATRTIRNGMAESRRLKSSDELDTIAISDEDIVSAVSDSVGIDAFEDVGEWSHYPPSLSASRQSPDVLGTYDAQNHHVVVYASAIVHFVRANQSAISALAGSLGVDKGGSWFNALAWDVLLHELGHAIHRESAGLLNFERATVELKESFAEALAAGAGRGLDGEVSLYGTSRVRCHVIRSVTNLPAEYTFWKVGFAAAGREDECPLLQNSRFLQSFLKQVVNESKSSIHLKPRPRDANDGFAAIFRMPKELGLEWSQSVQDALVGDDDVVGDAALMLWHSFVTRSEPPASASNWVQMLWSIAAYRHSALSERTNRTAIKALLELAMDALCSAGSARFAERWFKIQSGDPLPLVRLSQSRSPSATVVQWPATVVQWPGNRARGHDRSGD